MLILLIKNKYVIFSLVIFHVCRETCASGKYNYKYIIKDYKHMLRLQQELLIDIWRCIRGYILRKTAEYLHVITYRVLIPFIYNIY